MKLLQRLARQIGAPCLYYGDRLRVTCRDVLRTASKHPLLSSTFNRSLSQPFNSKAGFMGKQHPHLDRQSREDVGRVADRLKRTPLKRTVRDRLIFVLAVVLLTSGIGHRFYNAPKLDVGKAAPQTIIAPATATIEDAKATEEKRKTARKDTTLVLKLDQSINQQMRQSLQQQLEQSGELRRLAGSFPFTKTANLSLRTQTYLRQAKEEDWQTILNAVSPVQSTAKSALNQSASRRTSKVVDANQRRAVNELQACRRSIPLARYLALTQTIAQARLRYLTTLNSQPQANLTQTTYNTALLNLTDSDWQQTQVKTLQAADRILAQGIPLGLPEEVLTAAVKLQVKNWVPVAAEPIATKVLLDALQPNLIPDAEQTQLTAEQAAQKVQPEMVTIQRDEVIVRMNETITSADFALLDYFGLSRRGIDWVGLVWFGSLVSGAVGIYWFVERRYYPTRMRSCDRLLILLLSLSTPLLIALHVPSTNLPFVGLLVGSFYGSPLGVAVSGLLALGLPIGMAVNWSHLFSSAAAGVLCGVMAGRLRSREELALLGCAVGVLQGTLYLLLNVLSGASFYTLLGSTAIHALLGLAWCIVALGISPYLEQLFDLVTTVRLAELANPNRPLLKRLASETPGTFQHTLFVATLAEAAARALGCNVELVRTGTLYHDIGKMHDPMGFIENQMGGLNKHDLIDDPWKSAEMIKKHVTEGLVMARKARLPKVVQAFIPEHQGTMLIAYFYHQAQQRVQANAEGNTEGVNSVEEASFRYDGPAPQTRETGIVMLADSCEAALRSLKDASREEALSMINKILRARWQDNQLVNSGLTRQEMSKIAAIFVEVWQQFNHQRIAYPKLGVSSQPPALSK